MSTLRDWLLAEIEDIELRFRTQVLAAVLPQRRHERLGGGNSLSWATLHMARHAELAVAILGGPEPTWRGPLGLGEVEPDRWPEPPDAVAIERYALATIERGRTLLSTLDLVALEDLPAADAVLARAQVPADAFGWLYEQWNRSPRAFFVRWPLLGHQTNHIGEMIATRNRMGLSPYAA